MVNNSVEDKIKKNIYLIWLLYAFTFATNLLKIYNYKFCSPVFKVLGFATWDSIGTIVN